MARDVSALANLIAFIALTIDGLEVGAREVSRM